MSTDSKYYGIMRQWIADGATLDLKSQKPIKIEVSPQDPVVQQIGSRQQIRVVATPDADPVQLCLGDEHPGVQLPAALDQPVAVPPGWSSLGIAQ